VVQESVMGDLPKNETAGLLERLLEASSDAAQLGEYEVAYHALMAALHAAESARDLAGVDQVAATAREQEAVMESIQPPHNLSTVRAKERGNHSVYRGLELHAHAVRLRLRGEFGLTHPNSTGAD
jgi:hypothetical protein